MADAFICYSRTDRDFVRALHEALARYDRHAWVDWEGIPPTADFLEQIYSAIESADNFVFVISPDSVASETCNRELAHAVKHNKRLRPIVCREVDDEAVPEPLSRLNWIRREDDDFDRAFCLLIEAIETDLDWVRAHTRLLVRAIEWDRGGHDASFLLRGRDLEAAEKWSAEGPDRDPRPTALQTQYIIASRESATRRQGLMLASAAVGLAVAIGLALLAFAQSQRAWSEARVRATSEAIAVAAQSTAEAQTRVATSRELANAAIANLGIDPERSILLAVEAVRIHHTFESEDALRQALLRSYVRATLRGHNPEGETWQGRASSAGKVHSAAFSPDGRQVVTAGGDHTARVWDVPSGREAALLLGHEASVSMAVFSPDGRLIVTASRDRTARVWDAQTGQEIARLRGHEGAVSTALFSRDVQWVVTASEDRTARVWGATTGRQVAVLGGHEAEVGTATFSPDGLRVVTASQDTTARVWDATTGRQLLVLRGHTSWVTTAVFSPDGQQIVTSGNDATTYVWDANTGAKVYALPGRYTEVSHAAYSSDSSDQKLLATVDSLGRIRVWETSTGKQVAVIYAADQMIVWSASLSPDGRWVVTAGEDATARVWALDGGGAKAVFRGHAARVNSAAFSPDGRWVSTVSDDGSARIWTIATEEVAVFPGYKGGSGNIVFSPDRQRLATSGGFDLTDMDGHVLSRIEEVWLWDVDTGSLVATLSGYEYKVDRMTFSLSGQRIITAHYSGKVRVWDVATGREIAVWNAHNGRVSGLALSPNGELLATGGGDGKVRVWETSTWQQTAVLRSLEGEAASVTFSANGQWLLARPYVPGGTLLKLWDTNSWDELDLLAGYPSDNSRKVEYATFSPDGRWLAAIAQVNTEDGRLAHIVRVWQTGVQAEAAVLSPLQETTWELLFSPDGRWLAVGSRDQVQIWETATWSELPTLLGHQDEVLSIDFSPDKARIATASHDGTARVWDMNAGKEIASLVGHEGTVWTVAYSPDGRQVVTGGEDQTARLWDPMTGKPIAMLRGASGPISAAFWLDTRRVMIKGGGQIRIYATSIDDLLDLAQQRVTRELTCHERFQYLHQELECSKWRP